MNIMGVVFLGLVGLLGAYLYLFSHSAHDARLKQQELDHKIQVERFDRDFEKVWHGQKLSDPEREKRLFDLEKQQEQLQTRTAVEAKEGQAREHALRRTLDRLSGFNEKGQP